MLGQVLLRGDLASQWPSAFQSCRALLYLRIRRCLAGPLYRLAFYLKEKADLDPVALSPPCQSVSPPVSHRLKRSFSHPVCVFVCHFRLSPSLSLSLSLSVSLVCFYLSSVIPHLASFILSSLALLSLSLSLSLFLSLFLSLHTHTHTHLITAASVQHICLVSDVKCV